MANKMHEPARELVENVCHYVGSRIAHYINICARDYPRLRQQLQETMEELVDTFKKECQAEIKIILRRERKPFSLNTSSDYRFREIQSILTEHSQSKKALGAADNKDNSINDSIDSGVNTGAYLYPAEIEVFCRNKSLGGAAGIYKLQSGLQHNSDQSPTYYKYGRSKKYTIQLVGMILNKNKTWQICESNYTDTNSTKRLKILAKQKSCTNASNPIQVQNWDIKGIEIDSLDLIPFLNGELYAKMDKTEKKLFDKAVELSCYWKVVCDRICDVIPMAVRDCLVDRPCESRTAVQAAFMQPKRYLLSSINDHGDKNSNNGVKLSQWLMYLMSPDQKHKDRREYCEKTLKDLREAKRKARDIEYIAQKMNAVQSKF